MTIRKGLFFAFAAIIVLVPVYVAVSSQNVLNNGKLYKFRPMAYDPFDLARGKFLRVNYNTDNIRTKFDFKERETAYVSISVDEEGYAYFDEAFKSPPAKKDYLETKISSTDFGDILAREMELAFENDDFESLDTRSTVSVDIPDNLNKFFINEDDALKAEKVFFRERDNIYVAVKVLEGSARIENIYVHDKPILDYIHDKK